MRLNFGQIAVSGLCVYTVITIAYGNPTQDIDAFRKRCEVVKRIHKELVPRDRPENAVAAAIVQLERMNVAQGDIGRDFFAYYRARLLGLDGRARDAMQVFLSLVESWTLGPEAVADLWILAVYAETDGRDILNFWGGRRVPKADADFLENLFDDMLPPHVDIGPQLESAEPRATLLELARVFDEMNLHELALAVSREAWYAGPSFKCDFEPSADCGRLASYHGPGWLAAASSAQRRRDFAAMGDYLGLAYVFGTDEHVGQCLSILDEAKNTAQQDPLPPTPNPAGLGRAVEILCSLNLHPRALALLEEHGHVLGPELAEIRAGCEEEWLRLAAGYCARQEKEPCTFLGQEFATREQRLKVTIPFVRGEKRLPESLRLLRRSLREFLPLPAEEEKANPWSALELWCMAVRREKLLSLETDLAEEPRRCAYAQTMLGWLEENNAGRPVLSDTFLDFYTDVLLILAGRDGEIRASHLVEAARDPNLAPDAVNVAIAVAYEHVPHERLEPAVKVMSRLLPLTCSRNDRGYADWDDAEIERPDIPIFLQDDSAIGDAFYNMGMYERALSAYREVAFSGCYIYEYFDFSIDLGAPWIDENFNFRDFPDMFPGKVWIGIAKAEWQTGNAKGAATALGKVLMMGYGEAKYEAFRLIDVFSEGKPPQRQAPKPDPGKLKHIADLHAKRNMHPRAWELLEEYADVIGEEEAKRLIEKYQQEWLELLNGYFGDAKKCFLFGQPATTKDQRLAITVPPACRKEALEEAARVVKKLLEERYGGE